MKTGALILCSISFTLILGSCAANEPYKRVVNNATIPSPSPVAACNTSSPPKKLDKSQQDGVDVLNGRHVVTLKDPKDFDTSCMFVLKDKDNGKTICRDDTKYQRVILENQSFVISGNRLWINNQEVATLTINPHGSHQHAIAIGKNAGRPELTFYVYFTTEGGIGPNGEYDKHYQIEVFYDQLCAIEHPDAKFWTEGQGQGTTGGGTEPQK
ncbi:hypothetical protein [Rudaea sp.]|uniref:hypothetical protein n=1 Tax=Rudaea sp. TaxID=2136325 RepID=UPI002ED19FD6